MQLNFVLQVLKNQYNGTLYQPRDYSTKKAYTVSKSMHGKLYSEELVSTEGFSSDYSLLYHIHPPTQILRTDEPSREIINIPEEKMLKHRSLEGFKLNPEEDYLEQP